METVLGQPSWHFEGDSCRGEVTRLGGMTGPVEFRLGNDWISPFHTAPWAEEPLDDHIPSMLRALRGDFFCMPFGSNDTDYNGELHPPHGETANNPWTLEESDPDLVLSLETTVRPGKVRKTVATRPGEPILYVRHDLEGFAGPMSLGHHAMLRFPATGRISTSSFVYGATHPGGFEGATSLPDGQEFSDLKDLDLSVFPSRLGHEDLVQLWAYDRLPFAWTAVTFPESGYLWFSLKDPRILRSTILWFSHFGRAHAPWNGRHGPIVGLEEVTAHFNFGLAESIAAGEVIDLGLTPSISVLMGVAAIPSNFSTVRDIEAVDRAIRIHDDAGKFVTVPCDLSWITRSKGAEESDLDA